jgi:hypothetical protein
MDMLIMLCFVGYGVLLYDFLWDVGKFDVGVFWTQEGGHAVMSIVINCAPGVEMTLLKRISATSISAVGVLASKGQLHLSPPATKRVRLGLAFPGQTVQTKLL